MKRRKPSKVPRNNSQAPDAPARRHALLAAAVCAALLLAVVIVFGQTWGFGFVNYDDSLYVYENPHISDGLGPQGIAWAFTDLQFYFWHPLTWISLLLDFQLYGLNAWGYHLTNVLLHAATTILLFLVLWRMTGDLWPSAFVAAVFAIHPLQVESVAWVAERKGVLSGLFFVLVLAAYLRYVRQPTSLGRYLTVAAALALGLMAKPMLVTLPCVLLLLDYWPLGRFGTSPWRRENWRLVIEKIPLLLLVVAFCVATFLAERDAVGDIQGLSLPLRIANALVSYVAYLRQFFCPLGLAVFYPHPGVSLPAWKPLVALLLLVVISLAILACWQRNPYLLVGWLWFVGMLVPVSGLVQIGLHAKADRYMYLPLIGLAIALAWGAKDALRSSRSRATLGAVLSASVLMVLMTGGWQQTRYWRDSEALWRRDLDCTPENVVAHNNLALALMDHGRFDEAILHFQKALEINPTDGRAHNNLGTAFAQCGDLNRAMVHFRKAVESDPQYAEAHFNLGQALAKKGRLDEAIREYQSVLEMLPNSTDVCNNLGLMLAQRGRLDEAIAQFRRAVEIDPHFAAARQNLEAATRVRNKTGQLDQSSCPD